jgi:hypothetical protein
VHAEEFDVAGQARRVSEQMMQADMACMRAGSATDNEAGKQLAEGRFEIEKTALVKEHGSRRSDGDLRDAGDIVESFRRDSVGGVLIGKAAKRAGEDSRIVGENTEGASGEGVGGDGILKDAKRGSEARGRIRVSGIGNHNWRGLECVHHFVCNIVPRNSPRVWPEMEFREEFQAVARG